MTDTTSAAPSLLPCPFCGKTHSLIMGAASEMWDADEHGQYPHTETYAVFCDASTDGRKGGCGGAGGYRLTKDDAIEVWNRRVPAATPSDAEIDAQWRESVAKHETTAAFVRDFARAVLARWSAPQPDMTAVIARAKQEAIAAYLSRFGDEPQPVARVPLTDEQIDDYIRHADASGRWGEAFSQGIRWAIRHYERAHGIGTEKGDSNG